MVKTKEQEPNSTMSALYDALREDRRWGDIRRKAATDEGLQDLLNRVIVYYNLKYGEK